MKRALLLLLGCLAIGALVGIGMASAQSEPSRQLPVVSSRGYQLAGVVVGPEQGTPTPTPCVAGYACSVTPGATIVPGTIDTGNHCDDCVTNVTLPFPVSLYGTSYTSANLSSNGNAQLVSTNEEFDNTCLPFVEMGPTIFAYWDDLNTDGTNCTGGCGIYTSLSGTAPNRIFNIEWRAYYFSEPGNAYFEIRLYEGTSSFDVILGQLNTAATATIGVQDGAGGFTQCICNTQPPTNSKIVFTASICGTPSPTITPGGATNTPTRTSTVGPTNTIPPSLTATLMPTSTATSPPTQTPGGATATPVLSNTPVNTATATTAPATATLNTPATTSTATSTPSTPQPTATPCTLSFSDVFPTDYFYTPVLYLACHGVVSGYADGTFRPYNNTTRSQMTKIVVLGFGIPISTPTPPAYTFTDVPPSNPFFYAVETAVLHNIVSGYNCGGPGEPCDAQNRPYFRPYANVTRGQLSKIVVIGAGWTLYNPPAPGTFEDVPTTNTFYTFIETAYCHGIISGYNCGGLGEPCDPGNRPYFRPFNDATRGQIAKLQYLAITNPPITCSP
jgi:hypothetical protein